MKLLVLVMVVGALLACKSQLPSSSKLRDAAPSGNTFRGAVFGVSGTAVNFATATANMTINLAALPSDVAQALQNPGASTDLIDVTLPDGSYQVTGQPAVGIRPDCSELPLSLAALTSLVNASSDINDFLAKLPAGTLQTFTLVNSSKSPVQPDVTPDWPRVLRMNRDGSLFVAYTCNPAKPSFNKLEILSFDQSSKHYHLAEVNFAASPKVHADPPVCMNCHAPDKTHPDPRPIWESYNQWPGIYGQFDDSYYFDPAQIQPAGFDNTDYNMHHDEQQQYEAFLASPQRKSPCYATLAWPSQDNVAQQALIAAEKADAPKRDPKASQYYTDHSWPKDLALYPYSLAIKTPIYSLRPDLKFTEISSRHMASRMVQKLADSPQNYRLKYALYAQALSNGTYSCQIPNLAQDLQTILPGYKAAAALQPRGKFSETNHDPYFAFPVLYAISIAEGMANPDWTLLLPGDTGYDPTFDAAIPSDSDPGADVGIPDVVKGELLRAAVGEFPDFKGTFRSGAGSYRSFGARFTCLDQLPTEIIFTDKAAPMRWCTQLQAAWAAATAAPPPAIAAAVSGAVDPIPSASGTADAGAAASELAAYDPATAARGAEIVQTVCMRCHIYNKGGIAQMTLSSAMQFFQDTNTTRSKLQGDTAFLQDVIDRVTDTESPMPPSGQLSQTDQAALISYLTGLKYNKTQ